MVKFIEDRQGHPVKALAPDSTQAVSVTGTNANVTLPAGTEIISVSANTGVHIAMGEAATTSHLYLPPNETREFKIVNAANVVSFIMNTTAGGAWVTKLF